MAVVFDKAKGPRSRPMNVQQIVNNAQSFDYNPLIPLKYWLRTAGTLLKEARINATLYIKNKTDVCSTGGDLRA